MELCAMTKRIAKKCSESCTRNWRSTVSVSLQFDDQSGREQKRVLEINGCFEVIFLSLRKILLQQILLKKLPRTRRDDVANLENWHWNYNNLAIAEEEQSSLARTHDLFNVVPREKTPLRRLLERWKSFRIHWLWRDAEAPKLPFYETDVGYIADERVETFITVLILAIGLVMLIVPMWILQALQNNIPSLEPSQLSLNVFGNGLICYSGEAI